MAIALAIWKDDISFVYDALRNIQLANILFPKWTVRVLIPKNIPNKNSELSIKENILHKMKSLGAEIIYIDIKATRIPVSLISSLIADENNVIHFMIRDARYRLSDCDVDETRDFITSLK